MSLSRRRSAPWLAVAVLTVLAVLTISLFAGARNGRAASPAPAVSPSASASVSPSPKINKNNGLCAPLKIQVPDKLADLPVAEESICGSLSVTEHLPAVNAVDLFSVRRPDKVLVATLEVVRLRPDLDPRVPSVQSSIYGAVGDTAPDKIKVGDTFVYLSKAKGLTLATWFQGREVYVLAIRDIFDHPREMLRQALGSHA